MKMILTALASAATAAVLVIACGDDSPTHVDAAIDSRADAAACDCPAAEPPLAGRIMRVRGLDGPLGPSGGGASLATCPTGAILLSGWCDIVNDPGTPPQARITTIGASPTTPNTWLCVWENSAFGSAVVHAEAVCLLPPT